LGQPRYGILGLDMHKLLLNNAYMNDILHQPDALRDTLSAFAGQSFDEIYQFAGRLTTSALKRVVLTGMGSSYHALHPLRLTLTAHGFCTEMFETSELIHYAPRLLTAETLVVAVSQSGQSVEILQLLEKAHGKSTILGVTNTSGSPLALKSNAVLLTHAGSEDTVSCKTYVSTLAAAALLGDLLTGQEPTVILSTLNSAVTATTQYLSHWEEYVESAIQQLQGIRHLFLTGRGTSLATAGTGGLIIKESAHFHAEGISSASFRHGPFDMVSPDMLVLIFAGIATTLPLNVNLMVDICKSGGRAELITMAENESLFNLPVVPDVCLPLLEILPVQITSVALAILNNHVPGQFERGTKITVIE
jgi:glutamine---fructose-6-phosphate transaminase (isomerizing)